MERNRTESRPDLALLAAMVRLRGGVGRIAREVGIAQPTLSRFLKGEPTLGMGTRSALEAALGISQGVLEDGLHVLTDRGGLADATYAMQRVFPAGAEVAVAPWVVDRDAAPAPPASVAVVARAGFFVLVRTPRGMALTPALLGPHFRWRGGQAQPALLSVPDELREVLASGTPALADVQAAWDAAGARYSPDDLLRAISLAGWSVADAVELFTRIRQTPRTVDDLVPAKPPLPRRKPRSP